MKQVRGRKVACDHYRNPTSASKMDGTRTHIARWGETLSGIAQKNGIPLSKVVAANPHVKDPNCIREGDKIFVPNQSLPVPPQTTSKQHSCQEKGGYYKDTFEGPGNKSASPPRGSSRKAPLAHKHADRTAARTKIGPHASAGKTSSGDSVYAGFAMNQSRDPKTGIEVDVFSGSAQAGAQNEVQVGMARIGASSDDGAHRIGGEVFTAKAGAGIHNSDGSKGANAGVGAAVVGVEGTASLRGNSATVGFSVGVGLEGSIGIRDQDGDGKKEACVKGGVKAVTLGVCLESPFKSKK